MFAKLILEGKSASEAYMLAGFKPSRNNACRLRANESVKERIAELHAQTAKKDEITRALVLDWLQSDRLSALRAEQHAAAIRASELIGKELGMFVDKSERNLNVVQHVGDKPLSADDWAKEHAAPAVDPPGAASAAPAVAPSSEQAPPSVSPALPSGTKH